VRVFLIIILSMVNGIVATEVLGLSSGEGKFWVYIVFTSIVIVGYVTSLEDRE
jgi:uncharacterized membrane protein YoaK (UPF0700 family)